MPVLMRMKGGGLKRDALVCRKGASIQRPFNYSMNERNETFLIVWRTVLCGSTPCRAAKWHAFGCCKQTKGNNARKFDINVQNGQTQLATTAGWQAATRRSAGRRPVARDARNDRAGSRTLAGGSRKNAQKQTGNQRTTSQLQA